MAEITLHATSRTPEGTRSVRRLRGEGKIPGVVYGLGGDPINLTVDWRELRAALVTEQGLNAVIHLDIEGSTTPTLLKDMQRHPVRRNVLHVDFLRVDLNKTVDVEVAITLEGEAELVTRENGVVDQTLTALLITAKPNDIPSGLTVDISGLQIGEAIRVSDIVLPAGVTTSVDPEEQVVAAHHGVTDEAFERPRPRRPQTAPRPTRPATRPATRPPAAMLPAATLPRARPRAATKADARSPGGRRRSARHPGRPAGRRARQPGHGVRRHPPQRRAPRSSSCWPTVTAVGCAGQGEGARRRGARRRSAPGAGRSRRRS